jgi:formylglycine-generating enzyme required for sulfatase activity
MGAESPDIFVSYAREDEAWVRSLAAEIAQGGRTVFWDRRIPIGQTWHSYIGTAVKASRCVVVVWSTQSVISEWVLAEADQGKRRGVLMPVFKDPVEPPMGFGHIQAADLTSWRHGKSSEEFGRFLEDLARVLGPAPESNVITKHKRASADEQGTSASGTAIGARVEHEPDKVPSLRVASDTSSLSASPVQASLTPASAPHRREARARPRFLSAGDVFRDIEEAWCPEMVVIPAGSFSMGSPAGGWFSSGEEGRTDVEGPQTEVRITRPFALGRHALTRGQFAAFVAATGYDMSGVASVYIGGALKHRADRGWRDPGFVQTDAHPVICVSWDDAQTYVGWLSERTGENYRLPTEAEWEYAARGGTTTPFWTGATISTSQANYDGNYTYGNGVKGLYREQTVAVDDLSFPANPFGLFHILGNVQEWVQDKAADYTGAVRDGSIAVEEEGESRRMIRGGSWFHTPADLRSARRFAEDPDERLAFVGFRVARTLTR